MEPPWEMDASEGTAKTPWPVRCPNLCIGRLRLLAAIGEA